MSKILHPIQPPLTSSIKSGALRERQTSLLTADGVKFSALATSAPLNPIFNTPNDDMVKRPWGVYAGFAGK